LQRGCAASDCLVGMARRSLIRLCRCAASTLVTMAVLALGEVVVSIASDGAGARQAAGRTEAVLQRSGAVVPRTEAVVLRTASPVQVAVAKLVQAYTDRHRTIRLPGGAVVPRRVVTVIRYPRHEAGPLPLIVFGHGFAVTPAPYAALLRT